MRLTHIRTDCYLSLRSVELDLAGLNLFIGANASGKSNILNAVRFLSEGVISRDFENPLAARGGIIHLAWKGEEAGVVALCARFQNEQTTFSWEVRLLRENYGFSVEERVEAEDDEGAPRLLLEAKRGAGWWWSPEAKKRIPFELAPTACALVAAATDASFRARSVARFVEGWGFFDPSASHLRRAWSADDAFRLEANGRNLASRLHALSKQEPDAFAAIVNAARSVLGVPDEILFRVSDADGRVHFVQRERGLQFTVHQVGASSGSLRMLALMTALFGEAGAGLVGIEEPENHVHPAALGSFAEYLKLASRRVQVLVTTHSPLLLDSLGEAEAVCVVTRDEEGTHVERESSPEAVKAALEASGFGLGEYYQTRGFGA
jgi:predicted ATPase